MLSLKAHTATVTKILWGGENLIFTASKDQLLKVMISMNIVGVQRFSLGLASRWFDGWHASWTHEVRELNEYEH